MDEFSQAGRKGLQYAHSKGIPVFIMEPLRGGRLANKLPVDAKKIIAMHKPHHTPAQWSFKWLYNQPEVTCVLSGMNSMEMIRDNAKTASTASVGDLTASDMNMLKRVVKAINSKMKVGCTGCGYCVPCPKGVDIPGVFVAYNRRYTDNKFWGFVEYVKCTTLRKSSTSASRCVKCGKCEKHCPQGIPIRENLKKVEKEFEGPVYKIICKVAKRFMKF
jgi:predicted aldo/keto reductase-like oxidoreductase